MPRLRLMTWNVLFGVVANRLGDWDTRGPQARNVIVAAAPDVLTLQEIDSTQLDWVLHGVPGYTALVGEPTGVSSYPDDVFAAGAGLLLLAPPPLSLRRPPPRAARPAPPVLA